MANSLRDAESSRNPDARKYVKYVDRRRREARERWAPACEDAWWDTASTLDVMRAFTAASELADCDPEAASTAAMISDRLGLEPDGSA